MGWFRTRAVQPQLEDVQFLENPLFGQQQSATAEQAASQQRHSTQEEKECCAANQPSSPDAAAQPEASCARRQQQDPWPRAPAGPTPRSPAGLLHLESANHSASSSGGRHVPAPLLLPDDEPSAACGASSQEQLADGVCDTPGTVHGPDSPPQVFAGSKAPAHSTAHAAPSTPKAVHRLACNTPNAAAAAAAAAARGSGGGQHSSGVWQEHGTGSGSSSGSWSDGAAHHSSPANVSGVSLTTAAAGTPAGRAAASRRPTSAIQRHVQLQLQQGQQQQQQKAGSAAVGGLAGVGGEGTEDELFADLCACFGSLQAAVQLARTESGMTAERLPAAIAAVRASTDGGGNGSSGSGRPSSSSRLPSSAGAVSGRHSGRSSTDNSSRPASATWLVAAGYPAGVHHHSQSSSGAPAASDVFSMGSAAGGSRQLERGPSQLHASTSNANLFYEDIGEDDGDSGDANEGGSSSLSPTRSSGRDSRDSSHAGGSSGASGPLVLLRVGPSGKPVVLVDGAAAAPARSSGGGGMRSSSGSSPGSSRDSSVHEGVRSRSSIAAPPPAAAAGGDSRVQEQALQEQQQQQLRVLALQQEQEQLQQRRQQKQEQVVASYSCLSPHSPTKPSRHSFSAGEHGFGGGSRPSSGRPSSSRDGRTGPAQHAGTGDMAQPGGVVKPIRPASATAATRPESLNIPAGSLAAVPPGASSPHWRQAAASAAGSLQAPLPPSSRLLSAGGAVPSPRAKSAQRSTAASASLAGAGR